MQIFPLLYLKLASHHTLDPVLSYSTCYHIVFKYSSHSEDVLPVLIHLQIFQYYGFIATLV